ncbi:MAG: HlyD family efflux transporter periplasmic adaptor subunit [Candidatus Gracilibacteria bacterium]|nr:HlyD family efflux transporter periplasmic adaptor subunit [Candidatus Gracilibacteria bacterium]
MKKILSIIIISTILLTSCTKEEVIEKKYFQTHTVGEGFISSKDSILSTVVGMNVSDLSFKVPGRIKEIYVNKGDKIKAGQVLAILSNEEGSIHYAGAQAILGELRNMGIDTSNMLNDTANIKSAIEKVYDGKINLIENNYKKSSINIETAKKDLELSQSNYKYTNQMYTDTSMSNEQKIKQAENALNMAKNNLENSTKLLQNDKINIQINAVSSLTNAYIIARNARDYIDTIIGVTEANKNKNDAYEVYLGAKKSSTKNKAENSFIEFSNSYDETYKLYANNVVGKSEIEKDTLLTVLNKALSTLESLRINLHDTKDVLDNSIESYNLSGNTITNMQNQVSNMLGDLELAILSPSGAGIKGAIESINSFDKNYDLKIKQLEDAVTISNEDLNMAKTGKSISASDISKNLENLKTAINIKQDSLDIAKIGAEEAIKNIELTKLEKVSKLAEIDANLSQIKSKLSEVGSKKSEIQMNANLAINSIESGIIKAPFDGIIIDKYFSIGEVIGAGIPIIKVSSTDGKYIKTYIDNVNYGLANSNIVNLKNEKIDNTFSGTITKIDNTLDINSKKNYIEILINDDKTNIGDRLTLLLGKENKEKQIIIPINSVITKYSQAGVYVIENKKAIFKMINIIDSDSSFVAISGLKAGDKIITEGKDNILDGEEVE